MRYKAKFAVILIAVLIIGSILTGRVFADDIFSVTRGDEAGSSSRVIKMWPLKEQQEIFEYDSIIDIKGDIIFGFSEIYDDSLNAGKPIILLTQWTSHEYPWFNGVFAFDIDITGNVIKFDYEGVYKPSVSLATIRPVPLYVWLDIPPGKYDLVYSYGALTDRYILTVDSSLQPVETISSSFTISKNALNWSYRPNSFAVMCGNHPDSVMCAKFIDTLTEEIHLTEFTYRDTGLTLSRDKIDCGNLNCPPRYFQYESVLDLVHAKEILEHFRESHNTGYSIRLIELTAP